MNFIRAIKRDLEIPIVEWRAIIAITSNRRRVKQCLSATYRRSAQSGYMATVALRKFIIYIRGHLAEMENGEEWRPMVDMLRELLGAILKEHSSEVQKAVGEREARHITEERLDGLTSKRRC